jgi:hypothetical protein
MAETTEHGTPSRITLDEFIETVTRSVIRAVEAQGDVSGYALPTTGGGVPGSPGPQTPGPLRPGGPIIIGIIYNPQGGPFDKV